MERKPHHGEIRMASERRGDGYLVTATMYLDPRRTPQASPIWFAASKLNATPDERIPGLWHAPGYPELTTGQLLSIAARP